MIPTPEQIEAAARLYAELKSDGHFGSYRSFEERDIALIAAALSVQPAAAVVGEPEWWQVWSEEDQEWKIATSGQIAMDCDLPMRPLYAAPSAPDGWQPIETVKRNQSVILCSWWRHRPESPFVCEGYLDWDGVTWREQDGSPFSNDLTAPTLWMPLPAPPALGDKL